MRDDITNKNILDGNLTQKDIIQLLLHNTQHMATREEVKSDILKVESSLNEKIDRVESSLSVKIDRVESSLNQKIEKLDKKIDKVDSKFDKIQWLIVATILTILLKDYVFSFLSTVP